MMIVCSLTWAGLRYVRGLARLVSARMIIGVSLIPTTVSGNPFVPNNIFLAIGASRKLVGFFSTQQPTIANACLMAFSISFSRRMSFMARMANHHHRVLLMMGVRLVLLVPVPSTHHGSNAISWSYSPPLFYQTKFQVW